MIAQTLEAFGYRTVLAGDGAEAVRIYTSEPGAIAAVITDMMMPVMDGAATIEALTAIDPGVRIIGTSGLSLDGQPLKGGTTRQVRFLAKPYTTETLLATLHDVLRAPPG
ncbi:MAG: response regulator [Vicinamibacteria bacterium]